MKKRLLEIDALRGIAILMMIVFHFAFDLDYLGIEDIAIYEGGWAVWRRVTQFLFLGLVGLSVHFSGRGFSGQLKRGAFIFSLGMLITFATWIAIGDGFVKFGILHLIGVSVPVVVLFKKRPRMAVLFTAVILAIAMRFQGVDVENPWLFAIGLPAPGFYSLDYFPIFPWLAVPLLGLVFGESFYKKKKPTKIAALGKLKSLGFLGRHSLLIYMIHQPIIYYTLVLVF